MVEGLDQDRALTTLHLARTLDVALVFAFERQMGWHWHGTVSSVSLERFPSSRPAPREPVFFRRSLTLASSHRVRSRSKAPSCMARAKGRTLELNSGDLSQAVILKALTSD
ncbi:MAG: hypothetical protein AMXMBFR47_17020 [Planctomycetota bacterium]